MKVVLLRIWLATKRPSKPWSKVDKAGYKLGEEIQFALDAASSEFFDAEKANTLLERVTDRNGIPMRWSTFTPTS